MTKFIVQANNPRITGKYDPEDETLRDCIETVYILYTEYAVINWNNIFIPLGYKYDVSIIMIDILNMTRNIIDNDVGSQVVNWFDDNFTSDWYMSWDKNEISIKSHWHSVLGDTESLLNERNEITLDKNMFTYEWKKLLETISRDLKRCGYDETSISDFSELNYVCSRINEYGQLYREDIVEV